MLNLPVTIFTLMHGFVILVPLSSSLVLWFCFTL